jgi:hypothetical protein
MPLPVKLWIVWVVGSLMVGVATAAISSIADYSTSHWTFRVNGWALGSFTAALCSAVFVGLVALVIYA